MTAVVAFLTAFVAMEAVSYAGHRWVMHGFALSWHRSHHQPPAARFERNDRFPLCFSVVGFGLFAAAAAGVGWLWPVAAGVTAYGALYLTVHEVYIHHRLPVRLPRVAYLEWLRSAHREHHTGGGEPYGMLLPVVRGRAGRSVGSDPLDRGVVRASAR